MKKRFSIGLVFGAISLLLPSLVSAAPVPATSLQNFDFQPVLSPPTFNLPAVDPVLTCEVEGTNKLVGTDNEITYKIKYTSNYSKLNADYRAVLTPVVSTHIAPMINSTKGATSFVKGSGYIVMQGDDENTFKFKASEYTRVQISATVDDVACKTKVFNVIKPSTLSANIGAALTTTSLKLPQVDVNTLRVTTTLNIPPQEPAAPEAQEYTCSVLVEALPLDNDTILIGGALRYNTLFQGKYAYEVRGYRNDEPNNVMKYSGITTVQQNTKNGLVFNEDDRAFLFSYDSEVATDAYIITATLGNTDCSAVLFPSQLAQKDNSDIQAAATNSPAGSNNGSNGNVAVENTTESNGVVAVGLTEEERAEGDALNLLERTESEQVAAALEAVNEEDDEPASLNDIGAVESWDSSDYAITGLLGAILIALVGYGIMKYRGMM